MKPIALVLSCEHNTNHIPDNYIYLFQKDMAVLHTHRAYDLGALDIAMYLSQTLQCECALADVSRLLIDCNRSLKNPNCFSVFTSSLSVVEKEKIAQLFYMPYRARVMDHIQHLVDQNYQVLHLSIHSFTPDLNGDIRNADIGLLYDAQRHGEKEVARILKELMVHKSPHWRIRMNYPYEGKSDGLTTCLRKIHAEKSYLGFEIECNQKLIQDQVAWVQYQEDLANSIQELLEII